MQLPGCLTLSTLNQGFCELWAGMVRFCAGVAVVAAALGCLHAQAPDRIAGAIDATHAQALAGHRPAWALAGNDAGPVATTLPLDHLTLVLARSPQQEAAFQQLLKDQQNPASPDFHHWLTPAEIGQRFGLSDNDLAAISGWLRSQGLHVNWVSPSRIFIGFGGDAGAVGRTFQTELRNYKVNGELRMAPASDPKIPQALAAAVKAIHGLYTIEEKPLSIAQTMLSDEPQMTASSGSHYIAPGDFAILYDVPSTWTGSGKTIGIVARSRTDFADFDNFRQKTGSTFSDPTEVVPTTYGGVDPGPAFTSPPTAGVSTDDQAEATLDVLRAGSVAPGANLLLVVAGKSSTGSGSIADDTQYLVETTPVPAQVINISFGACESAGGAAGVDFWDTLFQQAAGEGISVFVASGDSGASGCDTHDSAPPATPQPNSPNYICSSSYATCVGGTEFVDTTNPSAYWNSSNGAGYVSALSYIPEGAWNDPYDSSTSSYVVRASGGGVSSVIATPSWQTGTGVPAARAGRYTPDIAFSASGHDGYFGCFAAGGGDCVGSPFYFESFGGTSAAAPDMAGITAMLDQKLGSTVGNLNPVIYRMAANSPSAFHDVTVASSGVGICDVNTPSLCNNSIASPTALTGGQAGYVVGAGYDEVTGWGSLDVSSFFSDYAAALLIKPTISVSAAGSVTTAQALPVTVAVSGGSGNPTPTGGIALSSGSSTLATGSLSSGSDTINVPAGLLPAGTDTITANYTPDSGSAGTYNSATGSTTVSVTAVVEAPTAVSSAATSITSSSATLNGTVNPNYGDTHVWFLYGTDSSLSGASQTTSQDIGSGSTNMTVSAPVTGLTANTTYYFQTVAQNSAATVKSAILSFATPVAPPPPSFSVAGTAVSVTAGATTGNTSTITITPSGGFTGTVSLNAAVTASPAGAVFPPDFTWQGWSVNSVPQVTITASGSQSVTLVISTTAPSTSCSVDRRSVPALPWSGGAAALACILLFGIPARRRRWRAYLGAVLLCVILALAASACSSGSPSHVCNNVATSGTTAGTYTVTITGTSGSTTATSTLTLIVQ